MVGADLVSQATRPAVDHHADLPQAEAHRVGRERVVDRVDGLHLEEVVPGPEAADLPEAPLHRSSTHLGGVGVRDGATVLAPGEVALNTVTGGDGVPGSTDQDVLELRPAQVPEPSPADAPRDDPVQPVHDCLESGDHLVPVQVPRRQQPDAARDVEPDTAGGQHAVRIHVRGRDAPDREAVPPVHVRHSVGRADDARQGRHVRHLLQRSVAGHGRQQLPGHEDHTGHPHASFGLDAEPVRRLLHDPQRVGSCRSAHQTSYASGSPAAEDVPTMSP